MTRKGLHTFASLSAIAAFVAGGPLLAGPLDPPAGPVTSTHKTLTEVEPRIAINAANTPGDDGASPSLYLISQPGSYYLTGNVQGVAGRIGIEILGPGSVTIDLMGFEVVGVPGSHDGIRGSQVNARNITILNGSVRGWGRDGIHLTSANNTFVRGVDVSANIGAGIATGPATTLSQCGAMANTGHGIVVGTTSVLTDCRAWLNDGEGIVTGEACTVSRCAAVQNEDDGFNAGAGSTLTGCVAASNTIAGFFLGDGCTITDCTSRSNLGLGINGSNASMISGCTATLNGLSGIAVVSGCTVRSNNCRGNGSGAGFGAGVRVFGFDNRIEANSCTTNDTGVDADSSGNLIFRNSCSGNTTNWDVAASNICLVLQAPVAGAIVGNSGGSSPANADSNANFTY